MRSTVVRLQQVSGHGISGFRTRCQRPHAVRGKQRHTEPRCGTTPDTFSDVARGRRRHRPAPPIDVRARGRRRRSSRRYLAGANVCSAVSRRHAAREHGSRVGGIPGAPSGRPRIGHRVRATIAQRRRDAGANARARQSGNRQPPIPGFRRPGVDERPHSVEYRSIFRRVSFAYFLKYDPPRSTEFYARFRRVC